MKYMAVFKSAFIQNLLTSQKSNTTNTHSIIIIIIILFLLNKMWLKILKCK